MTLASIQWVDWVIAAIVLVSALISIKRGFFREALSLAVWVFAIVTSVIFHEQLAVLLQPYIDSASFRKVAAIISLFLTCLLIGGLFSLIVKQLIKLSGLSGTDRFLGMVFGSLRGVVVVVVLLMICDNLLPLREEIWWQKSLLLPHVIRLESWTLTMGTEIKDLLLPLLNGTV